MMFESVGISANVIGAPGANAYHISLHFTHCRKFPKMVVIRNHLHCVTITITNNVVILMAGFQAVAI
jgi:hypothetical protein